MTQINTATAPGVGASPSAATPTAQALLPSESMLPEPEGPPVLDDLSNLYALMSEARRTGFDRARGSAEGLRERKQVARDMALNDLRHAEEKAREADDFLGMNGTLGDIAKVAAVVGAVGLAASTGGAGAVGVLAVAGAVMSSAAFAQGEFHYLEKLGVDEETAGCAEIAMWVAGAGCSLGAGVASLGGGAASTEATATGLQRAGTFMSSSAAIVSGGSAAVAGYATIRRGMAEGAAEEHTTDATQNRAKADRADRMLRFLLDSITESNKSDERALGHIRSAIEARGGALLMASRRV